MKFLLDGHVPPAVARGIPAALGVEVVALRDWEGGDFLNAEDEFILQAAYATGWILVTYDRKTIPPVLDEWGEQGTAHGGVIFVDAHTIAQDDVGGLIRALVRLIGELGDVDWENRVVYLRP
jgi:predicted nuclease of predicted toxin-antitoxin system